MDFVTISNHFHRPIDLYSKLKELEPFSLSFHHDADGVYSASLLMSVFQIKELKCPPFNEYETQVAVDLGYPKKKDWSGVIIDHHWLDYPEGVLKNPKITCVLDICPTGLIIWKHLKDHIPKEHWWKVVGSLTGDGQPELVPDEIWDQFPMLLEERGVLGRGQYKIWTSAFPLFYYLSSGVNAIARLGFPLQALDIVNQAEGPLDILDHPEVIDAVQRVKSEEDNIYKSRPVVETIRNRYVIIRIKTSSPAISMAGLIASKVSNNNPGKTIVVMNESNGEVSIRGVQARYVANKLNTSGFKAGGHAGFCGSHFEEDEIEDFMETLRKL